MSDLRRLFEQELRSLREEGADFAKDFPEAARFLEQGALDDRDPYVERLTEGIAFLTARVREGSDSETDGLTQHLLELLVAELEQPLASVAVVELLADSGFVEPLEIPAQSPVWATDPHDQTEITFRTLHPTLVDAVQITAARLEMEESKSVHLDLEFSNCIDDVSYPWPDSIPLFLLGDPPVVWAVRFALLRRQHRIQLWRDNAWVDEPRLSLTRLDQPGYASDRGIPSPLSSLRDFLCADERFRFVSLSGLSEVGADATVKLRIHLDGQPPRGIARAVDKNLFRLHAAVVINRFPAYCHSLTWDHTRSTAVLRAQGDSHREILDLIEVTAQTTSHPPRKLTYEPFSRYRLGSGSGRYQLLRFRNRHGRTVSALSLGSGSDPADQECQSLSIQAMCCDGELPHDRIHKHDFRRMDPRVSDTPVRGLTRPTPRFAPPEFADPRSRLLAFASGHVSGWLDADRLKDVLQHLMWDPSASKRTLVESIHSISTDNDFVLDRGVAWRRHTTTIRLRDTTCTPETWDRLGILDAFGSVLWGIVRDSAPIGSKGALDLVVDPAGVVLSWKDA